MPGSRSFNGLQHAPNYSLRVGLIALILAGVCAGAWGVARPKTRSVDARNHSITRCSLDQDFRDIAGESLTPRNRKDSADDAHHGVKAAEDRSSNSVTEATGDSSTPIFPAEAPDKGTGRISGLVVDSHGNPIAGANITASSIGQPDTREYSIYESAECWKKYTLAAMDFEERCTRHAVSDKDGRFVFTDLAESSDYTVKARHKMGRDTEYQVAPPAQILLVLEPLATLRVKLDAAGVIENGRVIAAWGNGSNWSFAYGTTAGDDGFIELGVRPGRVLVAAAANGLFLERTLELNVPDTGSEQVLSLRPAARLRVKVTSDDGKPLPQWSVTLRQPGIPDSLDQPFATARGEWSGCGCVSMSTNSAGTAEFSALAPGPWTLRVDGVAVVAGEGSNPEQNVTLEPGANTAEAVVPIGCRVVLTCTDWRGSPAAIGSAYLYDETGSTQGQLAPAQAAGVLEYFGLAPGKYLLIVCCAGAAKVVRQIEISEHLTPVEVRCAEASTLQGTLKLPDDVHLSNATVTMWQGQAPDPDQWWLRQFFNADVTNQNTFAVTGLSPGEWTLELSRASRVLSTQTVSIKSGVNNLELALPSSASLSITYTVPDGQKPYWFNVSLTSASQGELSEYGTGGQLTILCLEPGEYSLRAQTDKCVSELTQLVIQPGANAITVALKKINCARVTRIQPDSLAARIGLRVGDLLFEYDGAAVENWWELESFSRRVGSSEKAKLLVDRAGEILTFEVERGSLGADLAPGLR